MKSLDLSQNCFLIADFFHWELDKKGNMVIKENYQKNARWGG